MEIQLEAVLEDGKIILPACTIKEQVTGIYTDVQKMQLIMKQLQKKGYAHYATDGNFKRLKVEEAFRFYMDMAQYMKSIDEMMALFGLTKQRKIKIKNLTLSEQKRLAFLKAYLYTENVLVVEEPFYRMDEHSREIIAQLIQQLVQQGKQIILLANNIEGLLIATSYIIRIDQSGCHKMDFTEEQQSTSTEDPIIKIEKIQTKKNDKTILFNGFPKEVFHPQGM